MGQLPGGGFLTLYGQTEGSPITWLSPRITGSPRPDVRNCSPRWAARRRESRYASRTPTAPARRGDGPRRPLVRGGPDGWLHTGDLGRIGDDGYLYLVARRGNMIIRGSKNVYPQEVENRLLEHPRITDAAVIGVPDRLLGRDHQGLRRPSSPADPPGREELRAFARAALAGFRCRPVGVRAVTAPQRHRQAAAPPTAHRRAP